MDMLSYLTVLIKTRKEVGIPGLGTIYKKKSPGRYDAATHSFLPPSFVLDFNEEVLEQTLLLDHICKHRNISPDSANYFVEQFVEEIRKQLDEHNEASLKPLGTLYQSSGTLSFKPLNDQNFGFDFYGLPPIKDEFSAPAVKEAPQNAISTSEIPIQQVEHQVTEAQLDLENSNADLRDEATPPVIQESSEGSHVVNEEKGNVADEPIVEHLVKPEEEITVEQDEQPVFEEIAEVETKKQTEAQPEIESIGNIEEQPRAIFEEPVVTRQSINDSYAKPGKVADTVIQPIIPTPVPEKTTVNESFYNSDDEPEERAGIPLYLKILITLLLILIGLVAGYFTRPDLFYPFLKMGKNPIVVPVAAESGEHATPQATDSLNNADSLNKNEESTLPTADSVKKDAIATNSTTTTAAQANALAQPTGITFEIIAASVANQKEADRFIAQMKSLGLNAKAIPPVPGKKKIKISIATFNDYNSASAERPGLEKKLGIKDLYIHTNKPL